MFIKLYNKDGNEISERPSIENSEDKKNIIIKAVNTLYAKKYCPFSEEDKDNLIESLISHYYRYSDEYELAKDFENDGWHVDRDFIDKLEQVVNCIDEALSQLIKIWFDECQPLPPYEIWQKLKLQERGMAEYGVIDGIYGYESATYEVKVIGTKDDDTSRRLIKFENAIVEVK